MACWSCWTGDALGHDATVEVLFRARWGRRTRIHRDAWWLSAGGDDRLGITNDVHGWSVVQVRSRRLRRCHIRALLVLGAGFSEPHAVRRSRIAATVAGRGPPAVVRGHGHGGTQQHTAPA